MHHTASIPLRCPRRCTKRPYIPVFPTPFHSSSVMLTKPTPSCKTKQPVLQYRGRCNIPLGKDSALLTSYMKQKRRRSYGHFTCKRRIAPAGERRFTKRDEAPYCSQKTNRRVLCIQKCTITPVSEIDQIQVASTPYRPGHSQPVPSAVSYTHLTLPTNREV